MKEILGLVSEAVRQAVARVNFPGRVLQDPPVACKGSERLWLVRVCWEKNDHRGNRYSKVIIFFVWPVESLGLTVRPYFISDGPCNDVAIESFVYTPDHDGNIGIQLHIEKSEYKRVPPPWEGE